MSLTIIEVLEPSPIEFFHNSIIYEFHRFRAGERDDKIIVKIDGGELNDIVTKAKTATYEKYSALELDKPIPRINHLPLANE